MLCNVIYNKNHRETQDIMESGQEIICVGESDSDDLELVCRFTQVHDSIDINQTLERVFRRMQNHRGNYRPMNVGDLIRLDRYHPISDLWTELWFIRYPSGWECIHVRY